mgnify:FL=1
MGNIVLLDEHTVNKIAAGEVVDRPASIVKELVENAIDAKATSITVEIRNGGIKYIRVQDNGKGFASDDVEMAFERHATSKIRKEEDLASITSMGFRGEALASIAAISKVSLISKNENEDIGTKAFVDAGTIKFVEPSASTQGTKIEIFDVFYNVPARYKFLKKDSTEAGYIEDVVRRMALSNPSISFKYINNSKTVLQTSGKSDLKSVIYDIFGREIYDNVIPVEYEYNSMSVSGVIGLPKISRSTRMHQFTFVNSRYIKDKTINAALDRACSEKYAINKFPFCVINLCMSPNHLDVNVHPAKLEVKFEDETSVFDVVYHAVIQAIENKNREDSPFTNIKKLEDESISRISCDLKNTGVIKDNIKEKKFEFKFNPKSTYAVEEPKLNIYDIAKKENEDLNTKTVQDISSINSNKPLTYEIENKFDNTNEHINNVDNSVKNIQKEEVNVDNVSQENINSNIRDENNIKKEVLYKYIGNIFNTYIIIQIEEKMYVIDQHAAHERLLFEEFKESYYSTDRNIQMMLIPALVELTPKEKDIVMDNMSMFERAGFILDEFDEKTIKISGVPNIGYNIDYTGMFKDIIDEILGVVKTEKEEKEHRFLATLACKAAVKGNMKLDVKEQTSLIDKMVKLENPFTCPHGRPTAFEMSRYEIERKFLRK